MRHHYRDCDACGYVGLDSAGATEVRSERTDVALKVQCAKCGHVQSVELPFDAERERELERSAARAREATRSERAR